MNQRSPKSLFHLLLMLFRNNDDLFVFLANYDYSKATDLVNSLPSVNVPRATYTMAATQQLQAHGLDDQTLVDHLIDRNPGQRSTIKALISDYVSGKDTLSEPGHIQDNPPQPKEDSTGLSKAAYEKIMGDRPTFLDVSFLAIGLERASSVAMLRMQFSKENYVGTAFLVRPDLMVTAHHNLWNNGKRADSVEVIFDYERATGGAMRQSSMLAADLDSFFGDKDHDWAAFRLRDPLDDRPLVSFSKLLPSEGDRVAIIQHPRGAPKQVALHHNLVTFADDSRVQYLTDTLPGSSGSPVFNEKWEVVAVHNCGGTLLVPGTNTSVYRNQGVTTSRIVRQLNQKGYKI